MAREDGAGRKRSVKVVAGLLALLIGVGAGYFVSTLGDDDGSTSTAFFAGTDAAGMAVSTAVKGSTDAIAASSTAAGLPGDSGNAVKLAQLRFSVLTIDGATTTIDGAWGAWVSKLGSDTDQATRLREVQQNVLHVAQGRRDSVSGVNLDEEMADMVRFQKSYNAAARMVTTMDSMLETIVDRMGLVGR